MADNDLDKYLEDIGINVTGETQAASPDVAATEADTLNDMEQPDYDAYSEPPSEAPPLIAPDVITEGPAGERAESFLVNLLLNFDPAYAVEVRSADEETMRSGHNCSSWSHSATSWAAAAPRSLSGRSKS